MLTFKAVPRSFMSAFLHHPAPGIREVAFTFVAPGVYSLELAGDDEADWSLYLTCLLRLWPLVAPDESLAVAAYLKRTNGGATIPDLDTARRIYDENPDAISDLLTTFLAASGTEFTSS